MLEVKDLTVHYDGALVLDGINLKVEDGEFIAVVGPNGAGKSTLLRAISGLLREKPPGAREHPHVSGTITFDGKRIDKLKAYNIVKRGIVLCPERRRPFPEMTVLENLKMGAYLRKDKKQIQKDLEECFRLFPDIKDRGDQMAITLSGGEQQMLAIARSLMSKPKLLLIDEPSLGLAPMLKDKVFERIKDIQRSGVTILLVEQDVSAAMELADRIYVITHGRIAAEGTKKELMKNTDIRELYLGI
ncbi:MAG: ABC transporter ATP-binding protein [Candidatus Bathyarchaeaceae archaeon]